MHRRRQARSRDLAYALLAIAITALALSPPAIARPNARPATRGSVIRACFNKRTGSRRTFGALRLLRADRQCGRGTLRLSWNAAGTTGATGTAGTTGAAGVAGAIGRAGSAGAAGTTGAAGLSSGPAGGALTGNYPNPELNVANGPCANGTDVTNVSALAELTCTTGVYSDASENVGVLANPFSALSTGSENSAFGASALQSVSSGLENSAFGSLALESDSTGRANSALGVRALSSNNGSYNAGFGAFALGSNTTGEYNSAFGPYALRDNESASYNSAFGPLALESVKTTGPNSAFGYSALRFNEGAENAAVGPSAMESNPLGSSNTGERDSALGAFALRQDESGEEDAAVGSETLAANTSGNQNSALGAEALTSEVSGDGDVAVGHDAAYQLLTGSNDLVFGDEAGSALTGAESNDIEIGSGGTTGESNAIHIGGANGTGAKEQDALFIDAALTSIGTSGTVPLRINTATGQIGAESSSARFKTDIRPVSEALLGRLMSLKPVTYRYKRRYSTDPSDPRQYGLIAEEVAKVLPRLVVYGAHGKPFSVSYQELPVLLLELAQHEHARADRQQRQIDALRAEARGVRALHTEVSSLQARLAAIERALARR